MNDFISLYGLPRTAPMIRVFRKKKKLQGQLMVQSYLLFIY